MNKGTSYHETMLSLVDDFKVAGNALPVLHSLVNEGKEDMMTTVASHITMYDLHISIHGYMKWDHRRYIQVRHISGKMIGFNYEVKDSLRAVVSKATSLIYDLGVVNNETSNYYHNPIHSAMVLDIMCSLMDKYHVVEVRTGSQVDIKA